MGGTKIVVFQLKELIKSAIFVIIGLLLIIALVYFFIPKNNEPKNQGSGTMKVEYNPGEYSSKINLHNSNPLEVIVTVTNDKITDINFANLENSMEVFYPLLQPTLNNLAKEIIEKQNLEISIPVENKVTNEILIFAIKDALKEAVVVK